MLKLLRDKLLEVGLSEDAARRIENAPLKLNSAGFDPWGLQPEYAKVVVAAVEWLYRHYFRVETAGTGHIPQGRVLIIANHGGQVPVDGMLLGLSLLLDTQPPRIGRAMVERWSPTIPFVGTFFSRIGQVVGDPQNARDLLNNDECVLVFPEGTRGSGKLFPSRYQLQRFGTGFVRLALETKTPIVPAAIIGCEEMYPGIYHIEALAKLLKTPYFPVTPFFPLLGPLGMLPLPTKVTIRFGEPLRFEGDPDGADADIQRMVNQVKDALKREIDVGLRLRGSAIFNKAAK
ncbi:MAG: acyltransferase family protein [Bdellovibrionales bacterium]|nr:acyltransferase family protein [Bdellovibrionales bacterium]